MRRVARDPAVGLGSRAPTPRTMPGTPLRLSHQPLPHPFRPRYARTPGPPRPLIASSLSRSRARTRAVSVRRSARARRAARPPVLSARSREEGLRYQRVRRELAKLLRERLLAREHALLLVAHRVELQARNEARARARFREGGERRGARRSQRAARSTRPRRARSRVSRGEIAHAPRSARPSTSRRPRRPTWALATRA